MKDLGDYIHSKGLKYGIYSSASKSQCCSRFYPGANDGSLDHEATDAAMYAEFGVDYLKFDGVRLCVKHLKYRLYELWGHSKHDSSVLYLILLKYANEIYKSPLPAHSHYSS